MCGIAGYVGAGNGESLENMIASIKYRGPDNTGVFVHQRVGFAHARLSIIDLSPQGNQPMSNRDKSIVIVFNGEIYNFKELREELNIAGKYTFVSTSDTEVILHLYEEYGEDCFRMLNGMFAIALYDFREDKLVLARDRLGKKPLYWAKFNSTIIFASELKAVARHPSFKKRLNLEALNKYFAYDYVPTPSSIFENVYKLEPATTLTWKEGKVSKKKFWTLSGRENKVGLGEAVARLGEEIERSTKARLISDVPLGVFLSGGIDSSTIAYYAQKNSIEKIKTFSVGFREKSFDESGYARRVARFLNTDHYDLMLREADCLELVPEVLANMDEPLADASFIPMLLLSRFTKKYVTVALGGDGGDELFAGYPTFQAHIVANFYKKIPRVLRERVIEKIILNLPVSHSYLSLDFKLKKFIEGAGERPQYMHQMWLGSFSRSDREELFKPRISHELKNKNEFEEVDGYMEEYPQYTLENKLLYMYLRTYLMDEVMVKVDRASMRYALEVRSPFLDYKLVDFVSHLPYDIKCRGMNTKYVLKKLMEDKLPHEIVSRRKQGFGVPLALWLRQELRGFCQDSLNKTMIEKTGLFNAEYIGKIMEEHFRGRKDNRKKLWTLLVFMSWYGKYF